MLMQCKTVLILSPHTDDGELGAGGTMSRLARDGARLVYVAFSQGSAIDREVLAATSVLGVEMRDVVVFRYPTRMFVAKRQAILQDIIHLKEKYQPDLVLCPSPHDTHQDHEVVSREAQRAFKDRTMLGYELPWNNLVFESRCYWPLSKDDVQAKIKAIGKYKTQRNRAYTRPESIWSTVVMRGVALGVPFAECFEVVRWVVR